MSKRERRTGWDEVPGPFWKSEPSAIPRAVEGGPLGWVSLLVAGLAAAFPVHRTLPGRRSVRGQVAASCGEGFSRRPGSSQRPGTRRSASVVLLAAVLGAGSLSLQGCGSSSRATLDPCDPEEAWFRELEARTREHIERAAVHLGWDVDEAGAPLFSVWKPRTSAPSGWLSASELGDFLRPLEVDRTEVVVFVDILAKPKGFHARVQSILESLGFREVSFVLWMSSGPCFLTGPPLSN